MSKSKVAVLAVRKGGVKVAEFHLVVSRSVKIMTRLMELCSAKGRQKDTRKLLWTMIFALAARMLSWFLFNRESSNPAKHPISHCWRHQGNFANPAQSLVQPRDDNADIRKCIACYHGMPAELACPGGQARGVGRLHWRLLH